MTKILEVKNQSAEWHTPAYILDLVRAVLGAIDLDPASCDKAQVTVQAGQYFTAQTDGLSQPWAGRVFLNPPYGAGQNQPTWARKLTAEYQAGKVTAAILLCNCNLGYVWFDDLIYSRPVCIVRGRIKFIPGNGQPATIAKRASALVYFGPDVDKFADIFRPIGLIVNGQDQPEPSLARPDGQLNFIDQVLA